VLTIPDGWPCTACRKTKPFADLWAGVCTECRALRTAQWTMDRRARDEYRKRKDKPEQTPGTRGWWTEEEVEALQASCEQRLTLVAAAEKLGRTPSATYRKYKDLHMTGLRYTGGHKGGSPRYAPPNGTQNMRRAWPAERVAMLKAHMETGLSHSEIAKLMKTTAGAISGAVDRYLPDRFKRQGKPPRPRSAYTPRSGRVR
jgi:transposase-like protein